MVVLFTCAGQRVDIVTAFGRAGATTLAVDANPLAPALYAADRRALVPRIDDPGYLDALRELIATHDAQLVVPLADLDHVLLSEHRDSLSNELGALVLIAGLETIRMCEDKFLAHEFFEERGIATPPTWLPEALPDDLRYPLLVKARRGFGSRHIFRAADRRELDFFLGYTTVPSMVQAVCAGTEFSIDVFCDRDARCLGAVPRTMIESKGGESIRGMSIKDWELIEHAARVAEALGIVGPANIQCFREPDGSLPVTDVNPRFGGGFPVPTTAGSRFPELALALAAGESPEPRLGEFTGGVVMSRYFGQQMLRDAGGGLFEPLEEPALEEA